MPSIELTVKSLDDAAKTAAEQLGVPADQIKITVIEESKKLFGKVTYKVKAEAPDAAPVAAPKAEKAVKAPAAKKEAPAAAPAPAVEEEKPAPARKKLGSKTAKAEPVAEEAAPVAAEAAPVAAKAARPARGAKAAPKTEETPAAPAAEAVEEETGPEVVATQEDADKLSAILESLITKSGIAAEISVGELQGKYINLAIDGKEAGYFIGKSGEVLNSLQYLINLIAKQNLANGVRVTLDGNDYRKKRADALTNLAVKIAEKVKERGEEAVLDALPAFERRIIHKALQEIEGIATYSEGEEPDRRVVIAPLD